KIETDRIVQSNVSLLTGQAVHHGTDMGIAMARSSAVLAAFDELLFSRQQPPIDLSHDTRSSSKLDLGMQGIVDLDQVHRAIGGAGIPFVAGVVAPVGQEQILADYLEADVLLVER